MARNRRRGLTREDRAAWTHVAKNIAPLKDRPKVEGAPSPKVNERVDVPTTASQRKKTEPTPRNKNLTVDLAPDPMEAARTATTQMDAKRYAQLRKGKLVPDARIDLHGMTAERAHRALDLFIETAFSRGDRLVLVITGKGRAGDDLPPARRGILRNAVPVWLRQGAHAARILQVAPAHRRHGGEGAYYVYLRRRRG